MKVIELIHDSDQPEYTNVDYWIKGNKNYESQKIIMNEQTKLPDYHNIDLVIVHGGSQHLWNKDKDPWLYKEISYVREVLKNNIPVIGFCLGSQIIAEALEGKVFLTEEKEAGWFDISIRSEAKHHQLFNNLQNGFTTFLWHSDHYTLPDDCSSLGFTEAAENQIIISNIVPAIGFQFHPEYTKENIQTYLEDYDESYWTGGKYALGKEYFIKQMETIPETYDLFEKLMTNSIAWILKRGEK
ncbi:MAG: type 1 glutamine amidotransferase [Bacillota bacterium]|nr:type 1 glutamine amidotransferase [Bacillota bacterium]